MRGILCGGITSHSLANPARPLPCPLVVPLPPLLAPPLPTLPRPPLARSDPVALPCPPINPALLSRNFQNASTTSLSFPHCHSRANVAPCHSSSDCVEESDSRLGETKERLARNMGSPCSKSCSTDPVSSGSIFLRAAARRAALDQVSSFGSNTPSIREMLIPAKIPLMACLSCSTKRGGCSGV